MIDSPVTYIATLPEPDREVGIEIATQMLQMESSVSRFQAALALATEARERVAKLGSDTRTVIQWGPIAQRDAGMTIYDFMRGMANIKKLHGKANS